MSDFMSIFPTEPRFLLVDASSPASSNRYYRRDMPSVMNEKQGNTVVRGTHMEVKPV